MKYTTHQKIEIIIVIVMSFWAGFLVQMYVTPFIITLSEQNNPDTSEKVLGSDRIIIQYGNLTSYCNFNEWDTCVIERDFEYRDYWVKFTNQTVVDGKYYVVFTTGLTENQARELYNNRHDEGFEVESNLPNISDNQSRLTEGTDVCTVGYDCEEDTKMDIEYRPNNDDVWNEDDIWVTCYSEPQGYEIHECDEIKTDHNGSNQR